MIQSVEKMTKEKGLPKSMLSGEEIVYRIKAGRLSFFKFMPGQTITVTNKRLILSNPLRLFSGYDAITYEKMQAIEVKRGIFGSKFIVKTGTGKGERRAMRIYRNGHLLTIFGIISNQIAASRDQNYTHKISAHRLDGKYAVLNTNVAFEPPHTDQIRKLASIVRTDQPRKEVRKPQFEMPAPIIERFSSAERLHPGDAKVNYFAEGLMVNELSDLVDKPTPDVIVHTPKMQQLFKQKEAIKTALNPDKDLKIFKVRKMRGPNFKGSSFDIGKLNPFNLFSAK